MEYGLSRIILIDSYLPGRLYTIDLNGHTNVMGENDMGKTTLIKLAVLFYGESPVKLGIKRNDALKLDGFAEHYLPRSGSYVIFEYISAGEPRMLVFSSLPDTKEQFRRTFVKSGFKRDDFWTANSDLPLMTEQWLKDMPLKYKVEHCTSGEEQTRKLLEGRNPHFSMVPSRLNLTRMRSLMTSMFSRNAGHTELTKIIEEWARSDLGGEFSRQLETISVPRAELESWVNNYNSFRYIERAKERFSLLDNIIATYDTALEQAKGLFSLGKLKRKLITKQIDDEALEFRLRREQLQNTKDTQNGLLLQLRKDYKECNTYYQKLVSEQSLLDSTLETLREKVPSSISEMIASNAGVETRICQIDAELAEITIGQNNINEWKRAQSEQAKEIFDNRRQALKESLQHADSQKYKSINEHHKHLEQQFRLALGELENHKNNISKSIISISEEISIIKGQLVSPSLSKEEMQKQKELQEELDALENARELASKKREEANNITTSVKRDYEKELSKLANVTEQLKVKEDELNELLEILNAQDGSFLSYLKQHVPEWQETHGRALKPEVLRAKGLSPKLNTGTDIQSIFGIEIDVSALPENYLSLSNDAKLRERVIVLEDEVAALLQEQEKINAHCMRLSKKITETERNATLLNSDYEHKNKLYSRFKTDLSTEKVKLSELLSIHIETLERRLESEELSNQALIAQLHEIDNEIQTLQAEISQKKLTFEHDAEVLFQNTAKAIAKNEELAHQEYQQREEKIDEQYNYQLREGGVDADYVSGLITEKKKLKTQNVICKNAENAQEVFLKYQSETYLPRYPYLIEELAAETEKRLAILESAKQCEIETSKIDSKIQSLETTFERTKNLHKKSLARIEEDVLNFEDFNVLNPPVLNENYNVEQICQHFKELRTQLRIAVEQAKALNAELSPLFRSPGTGAFDYLTSDPGNTDDPLQVARRINRYLSGGFYQVDYTSFIQSTQNFDRVTLYVDYLRQFKTKIHRYNRGLNDHMVRAVAFNGIEHLEVDITFQYSDKNDWALINDIAEQYLIWKNTKNFGRLDSSKVELPQQGLVDAIGLYLSTPSADNMSVSELYKHIDFAIKITDNGREKIAKSFIDILSAKGGASSNGTSYLILITIFVGILNMMRSSRTIHFTWALDELADISPNNIAQLLKLLEDNNINLISACTVASESVYLSFNKTYTIEYDINTGAKIIAEEEATDPLALLLTEGHTDMEQSHA